MKKLSFSVSFAVLSAICFSQSPILDESDFTYKLDSAYTVHQIEWMNPGEKGENVVWDFTGVEETKSADIYKIA